MIKNDDALSGIVVFSMTVEQSVHPVVALFVQNRNFATLRPSFIVGNPPTAIGGLSCMYKF